MAPHHLIPALFAFAGFVQPALADCALETGERVRIASTIDGDTVALEGGGEVRLVGIQAPKLPLGRRGFVEWPLAPEAREALSALADGHEAELRFGGTRGDRHGRILAHLYVITDDGRCGHRARCSMRAWPGSTRFPTTGPASRTC